MNNTNPYKQPVTAAIAAAVETATISSTAVVKSATARTELTNEAVEAATTALATVAIVTAAKPAAIAKIQTLSKRNFDEFVGDAWNLPSGTTLDKLLVSHVETLPDESSIHSFVVEVTKEVMQLIRNKKDRELLQADRIQEQLPAHSEPEKAFLTKYNLPPDGLKSLLATSGWRTIGGDLETKPDEKFQEAIPPVSSTS
jgi:hypothetical protein